MAADVGVRRPRGLGSRRFCNVSLAAATGLSFSGGKPLPFPRGAEEKQGRSVVAAVGWQAWWSRTFPRSPLRLLLSAPWTKSHQYALVKLGRYLCILNPYDEKWYKRFIT